VGVQEAYESYKRKNATVVVAPPAQSEPITSEAEFSALSVPALNINGGRAGNSRQAGVERFVSTDSWQASPPDSGRQPIPHFKSANAALEPSTVSEISASHTDSVTSKDVLASASSHSGNNVDAATLRATSLPSSDGVPHPVTKSDSSFVPVPFNVNIHVSREEATHPPRPEPEKAFPPLQQPVALNHKLSPPPLPDTARFSSSHDSLSSSYQRTVIAQSQPSFDTEGNLLGHTNGNSNGDHNTNSATKTKERPSIGKSPSVVSDLSEDSEIEDQKIVKRKETQFRQQLVVLTDLEEVVEVSAFRMKLMTRIRSRIAEIERTLQSVAANKRKNGASTPAGTATANNGEAGHQPSPSPKKKVELDDTSAKADIQKIKQSRLKSLASFNHDDEVVARDYESQLQKVFVGLKVLATEEQLDCAPGLAVVLFNKAAQEYRLFFVCSYTLRILACGVDGEGFLFKRNTAWAKEALPAIKFCLFALRCGIIQHTFDHSSNYSDLCRPTSCRVYLNDIIRYVSEGENDIVEEASSPVRNANHPLSAEASVWDLFGTLSCASTVLGYTGKLVLDTFDTGVGSCARAFGGDSLTRICSDPDTRFRLTLKDVPNASKGFAKMLNSVYGSKSWKESNLTDFPMAVCVDDRGVHWVDKAEEVLRAFQSETE
jgi:hypothetical protein